MGKRVAGLLLHRKKKRMGALLPSPGLSAEGKRTPRCLLRKKTRATMACSCVRSLPERRREGAPRARRRGDQEQRIRRPPGSSLHRRRKEEARRKGPLLFARRRDDEEGRGVRSRRALVAASLEVTAATVFFFFVLCRRKGRRGGGQREGLPPFFFTHQRKEGRRLTRRKGLGFACVTCRKGALGVVAGEEDVVDSHLHGGLCLCRRASLLFDVQPMEEEEMHKEAQPFSSSFSPTICRQPILPFVER